MREVFLTFHIQYPCSEDKGADQLRGHREVELHLYFRSCMQKAGFLMALLNMSHSTVALLKARRGFL